MKRGVLIGVVIGVVFRIMPHIAATDPGPAQNRSRRETQCQITADGVCLENGRGRGVIRADDMPCTNEACTVQFSRPNPCPEDQHCTGSPGRCCYCHATCKTCDAPTLYSCGSCYPGRTWKRFVGELGTELAGQVGGLCELNTQGQKEAITNPSVCPHNKCGEVRGCSLTCHCPDHDTCNPVNCDCGRKLCHKDYRGAGCQDRLPQLARSPTVSFIECNTVKVQWNAYNMEVDVGSHPEVGRYDIHAGMDKHTENGWIKLKEVPFARGVTRYSEEVSKRSLAPDSCYFFRVDVVGFEDDKPWSEIAPGKHTSTSVCNKCSEAPCPPDFQLVNDLGSFFSFSKKISSAEQPRHASLVDLLVGAILTWAVGRVASGHGQ